MNLGRLLVIFVDRSVFRQPSSLDFSGLRLRLSFDRSWSAWLASSDFSACFRLIFTVAFVSFFHLLWPVLLTCLVFQLAWCFNLLGVSTCLVFQLAWCFNLLGVSTCLVFQLACCFDLFGVLTCFVFRLASSLTLRLLFAIVDFAWSVLVVSLGFGREMIDVFRGMAIVKTSTIGDQGSCRYLNSSRLTVGIVL